LYKPQLIDESDCGAIGAMNFGRGNQVLGENLPHITSSACEVLFRPIHSSNCISSIIAVMACMKHLHEFLLYGFV
jgi:hypothetical protein